MAVPTNNSLPSTEGFLWIEIIMVDNENQPHVKKEPAYFGINNAAIQIYTYVMFTVLCQIINIFGIVTNGINISCFAKQGFKDSINVSLLGLSISDLASLVTLLCTCILITPALSALDLPFDCMDIIYLITAMLHFAFTRVSSCITAMITLEKCLSISAPLKVKSIITPKRATAIIICIFITLTFSIAPEYVVNRLDSKFSPLKNKTVIGIVSTANREQVERVAVSLNNFFIPFCAFVIIASCTVILSILLHKNNKWRKTTIADGQEDRVSNRNQKVAKMVVTISILFIVCFIPSAIMMLAVAFEPSLWVHGKYLNITVAMAGFSYLLVSVNSSVNIFIYYSMSTKYRDTFTEMFRWTGLFDAKHI